MASLLFCLTKAQVTIGKNTTFTSAVFEWFAQLKRAFTEDESEAASTPSSVDPRRIWSPHRQFDRTWSPKSHAPISNPETIFSDLEISVQNVNITDILSRLRKYLSARNEISGTVYKDGDRYSVRVLIRGATSLDKADQELSSTMFITALDNMREAAFHVACGLIWREAALHQSELRAVGREEFCQWADIWLEYRMLKAKLVRQGGLTDEQVKKNAQLRERLTVRIDAGVAFPLYYRLRANLIDLLPAKEREKLALFNQAQSDLIRYAVLQKGDGWPGRVDPLDTETAYSVLAEARPAIVIADDKFKESFVPAGSAGWRAILEGAREHLEAASRATGYVTLKKTDGKTIHFTAFAVAPNVLASVGGAWPANSNSDDRGPRILDGDVSGAVTFQFADTLDPPSTSPSFQVRRRFYVDVASPSSLMLLEIVGHDVEKRPPIRLPGGVVEGTQPRSAIDSVLRGDFVALIGYPDRVTNLPESFAKALLPNHLGAKRIMPARITRTPVTGSTSSSILSNPNDFVTDASTTPGLIGSPLIDLRTGNLLGIQYGGKLESIRKGSFSYARSAAYLFRETEIERIFLWTWRSDHS